MSDLTERLTVAARVAEHDGYPVSVDPKDLTEAAARIKALEAELDRLKHLDARLHVIRDERCKRCALTRAECADTIAQMEVDYRQALSPGEE